MTIRAKAKINFTLEVLGKRPDGYHALRSVVMPLDFGDDISVVEAESGVSLSVKSDSVTLTKLGPESNNLAVRAAKLIMSRFDISKGVALTITKRIPIGGGMGGGSADAAAVLRALNNLWNLSIPETELIELAAELGSDVPALVLGGAVLMEGRGERVCRLLPEGGGVAMPIVVANPGVHCSTPEIFKAWNAKQNLTSHGDIVHNTKTFVRAGDVGAMAKELRNDLQQPAFERYPEIARLAAEMRGLGCLGVLLSGSGASVFGLTDSSEKSVWISEKLKSSGVWSVATFTCPMV